MALRQEDNVCRPGVSVIALRREGNVCRCDVSMIALRQEFITPSQTFNIKRPV